MPISEMNISFDSLKDKKFAVAVSGGSDSLALLSLLVDAGLEDQFTVLHFDHNLRCYLIESTLVLTPFNSNNPGSLLHNLFSADDLKEVLKFKSWLRAFFYI